MDILVLGGTAWVGREVSRRALARGHAVTCLARGESGGAAEGAELVVADRREPGAYDGVAGREWDAVVEVSWQPAFVKGALEALGGKARHWTYVSSGNVYASHAETGGDESAALLEPTELGEVGRELYGEAKVACELASQRAVGERLLVARAGLIGGPGDASGRSGYWVARSAREPRGALLVPDEALMPTRVVDVRDLVDWILDSAEKGATGVYDAVGPQVTLGEWIGLSREIGGHTGAVVPLESAWLLEQGVEEFMGEDSLPLWIVAEGWGGFQARSGEAALAAGLRHRSREELITDTLAWEREQGLGRERRAGLGAAKEAELLELWGKR
ncbi:NAD-dependent epimerase/dehydratase family protein [Streptomyces filamentosus]